MPTDVAMSMRELFAQLDGLVKNASEGAAEEEENKKLLLKEFAGFFGVEVGGFGGAESKGETPKWTKESTLGWVLNNLEQTATMSACGGWRTLVSESPLEGDQVYVTIHVHALRTLAVGISQGDEPSTFVGDSATSWAYQSTGHMINSGSVLDGRKAPEFQKGDTVGVLLDKKQQYIAFYKNGHMAGVPFTDISVEKPFKLAISCYTGPCSISVNMAPLGAKPVENIKTFPICIGAQ